MSERQWITLCYFEDAGEDAHRLEPLWGPQTGHNPLCCCQLRSSVAHGNCSCLFERGGTEFKFSLNPFHFLNRYVFILASFLGCCTS